MDDDLIDLIAACRGEGDEIDADRRVALVDRLRRDEAFQRAFVDEIRMLGMLKAVQSMEPRWLRLQDELGWGPGPADDEKRREDHVLRRLEGLLPRRSRRLRSAVVSAAAALVLIGTVAILRPAHPPALAPNDRLASPSYPSVDVEAGLAMVVGLDGVAWDDDGAHPTVGDLLPPGRFRFREGRVTLSMLSGVSLIVEGPADLDLIAVDRVFCRWGRLRTRVPKGAEGLVISSSAASVLDLGTEFGLNVEPGGKSLVKVFQGRVEAMLRTGAGSQNISRYMDDGEVFAIDPAADDIKDVEAAPGDFAGAIDPARRPLSLDASYRDAVLESHPWGYWRFESIEDGAVANEVPGRPPLRMTGQIRIDGASGGNRVAEFPPDEDLQYLTMEGLWQPEARPGYAVEVWFQPESIDHSSLISLTSPAETNHHVLFLETGSRNRFAMHPPAKVRFLDRWPPATGGGYNIYSNKTYIPYRWHHLVGQLNGGRMELFLDGEPTYSQSADLSHPTAPGQLILGRLSTVPLTRTAESRWYLGRPFVGRLDEVAVYNHPLTIEEIRRHRLLATSPSPVPRPGP